MELDSELKEKVSAYEQKKDGVRDFLSSLNSDKVANIKQVIDEINELIDERNKLSDSLILSYENILSKINGLISRMPAEAIQDQIKMHEKYLEVEQSKVREKLDCWRDIASLKRELRERLQESREQEKKNSAFSSFLEDE